MVLDLKKLCVARKIEPVCKMKAVQGSRAFTICQKHRKMMSVRAFCRMFTEDSMVYVGTDLHIARSESDVR